MVAIAFLAVATAAAGGEITLPCSRLTASGAPWQPERIAFGVRAVEGREVFHLQIDRISTGYVSWGARLDDVDLAGCVRMTFTLKADGLDTCRWQVHLTCRDGSRWQSSILVGPDWATIDLEPDDFSLLTAPPGLTPTLVDFTGLTNIGFPCDIHHRRIFLCVASPVFHSVTETDVRQDVENLNAELMRLRNESKTTSADMRVGAVPTVTPGDPAASPGLPALIKRRAELKDALWRARLETLVNRAASATATPTPAATSAPATAEKGESK